MDFPSTASRREPAINVPAPLLVGIAILAAIHAVRSFLAPETDIRLLIEAAFVPAPWSIALGYATPADVLAAAEAHAQGEEGSLAIALAGFFAHQPLRPWSALSYSVLHGSWAHLGLNCLWLVAFGTSVVRRAGAARSLVLWVAAALGGALAQWMSGPLSVQFMIGASASVSGFMAAAATFMYEPPGSGRWAFLRNRGALIFLGLWLACNLIFAVIAQPMGLADGEVAWQAHIGGLIVGIALFPLLDPYAEPRRSDMPS
ncbi:rhomboid family intramembrane serine protease [Enterovirga sp.]|uniref:rhomboid family intramembrane serine protease n=1 Tax=Enterovirga sp. TaxID=2026350 RepID=UPI002C422417|nr:rhomboid family intramembrane serine protease [Enterovirga sp.]HMO29800.1 rhomboid family intramembrane serine protease [Enterovirga sp.]